MCGAFARVGLLHLELGGKRGRVFCELTLLAMTSRPGLPTMRRRISSDSNNLWALLLLTVVGGAVAWVAGPAIRSIFVNDDDCRIIVSLETAIRRLASKIESDMNAGRGIVIGDIPGSWWTDSRGRPIRVEVTQWTVNVTSCERDGASDMDKRRFSFTIVVRH